MSAHVAIEFGSKKMKFVVGYVLDGQVYVIYASTKDYGHIIECDQFIDIPKLVRSAESLKNFVDEKAKTKMRVDNALLVLPPFGLNVLENSQVTTVIGDEGKVSDFDVRNIYALIRTSSINFADPLVDIIPEVYVLDHGIGYEKAPIGVPSTTLTVNMKVHTLPEHILNSHSSILKGANINIEKNVIAPYGACELLGSYEDLPSDYLLVDIGSNITTVSLIGNKKLFISRYIEWGGDEITERIIEGLNINEVEAEKLKRVYGLDKQQMHFRVPVSKYVDFEGKESKHYADELYEIVKGEVDKFASKLTAAIDSLLAEYNSEYKKLPMILIGGGSQLNGLVEYITPKVESETVTAVTPRSLGAREGTFINCLGAILANDKYPNLKDEMHQKIGSVSRVEK